MARLTADVVLLARREDGQRKDGQREDGQRCVLLIRRGWEPHAGCWALPGGHVDAGEDTAAAASRELLEETGLYSPALDLVGVYAAPGRDPRGRYVTFAYTATLDGPPPAATAGDDDATEARWWLIADLVADPVAVPTCMAFDHHQILTDTLRAGGEQR